MDLPTLLIGDTDRPEFHEAAAWLTKQGALAVVDIPSAVSAMQGDFVPAIIVIAESWPGQFSRRELDCLRRAAPLARIVGLLGSWVEGETRTGKPWPTLLRMYWHQAVVRLKREIEQADDRENSRWSLPITAGDNEGLLLESDVLQSDLHSTDVIAICARHRETAEALGDVCRTRGWGTVWLRSFPSDTPLRVSAVLFDLGRGDTAELKAIASLKTVTEDTPIIALVAFPRAEDIERLRSAGATSVVSKPFMSADLIWSIEQLLATTGVR